MGKKNLYFIIKNKNLIDFVSIWNIVNFKKKLWMIIIKLILELDREFKIFYK